MPQVQLTDPPSVVLPDDFSGDDVIVLPREVAEDGRGLYDESVITVVKEFRSEGVRARYQHDQQQRSWIGERGVPSEVIDLVIGIASNAGWSALCRLLSKNHGPDYVRVRVGRFRKTPSEISWDWYRVEGTAAAVAEALTAIEQAHEEEVRVGEEQGPETAIEQ